MNEEKERKYDRQLRLWGARGQIALSKSSVLLINAGCTGTESLKNLVLPGVGSFCIVDSQIVDESDIGNNFFVTDEYIGRSRAEAACTLLQELNPDVKGSSDTKRVEELFSNNCEFLKDFDLVIATQLNFDEAVEVSNACWRHHIPLLICRSYGFIGTLRLQVQNHEIVESKPDTMYHDLRIASPWYELKSFADSINLDLMNNKEHGHVPYIVILLKAMNQWKESNNDQMPTNVQEKNSFKQTIKAMARNFEKEINFQEAFENAHKAFEICSIPTDVEFLLKSEKANELSDSSSPFQVLCHAMMRFTSKKKYLPLNGSIPDMTSDSDQFVQLQSIYKAKAEKDFVEMSAFTKEVLNETIASSSLSIDDSFIRYFCQNARNIMKMSTSCYANEVHFYEETITEIKEALNDHAEDMKQTPILWFIGLRAADAFYQNYGRYPGTCPTEFEKDSMKLQTKLSILLKKVGVEDDVELLRKISDEVVRYGASEMHCVGSVLGGVASQESVKLLTKQYVPLDNTYVYNGISNIMGIHHL